MKKVFHWLGDRARLSQKKIILLSVFFIVAGSASVWAAANNVFERPREDIQAFEAARTKSLKTVPTFFSDDGISGGYTFSGEELARMLREERKANLERAQDFLSLAPRAQDPLFAAFLWNEAGVIFGNDAVGYQDLHSLEQAITLFQNALRDNPDFHRARLNLELALRLREGVQKAQENGEPDIRIGQRQGTKSGRERNP